MSFADMLEDDDVEEVEAEVVVDHPAPPARRTLDPMEQIRSIEDELHRKSLAVVSGAVGFAEIDPYAEEPPEEWIAEFGEKAAWERFRVAQAAWLPPSKAPMGIKVSTQVGAAIINARATEKSGNRSIAIHTVNLTVGGGRQYPELEVEK